MREIVLRLQKHEMNERTSRLLADAKRYQLLLAAWRQDPPDREEQFEIVGHVLQLLGSAMQVLETPRMVRTDMADDPIADLELRPSQGESPEQADDHPASDSEPPQHHSGPPPPVDDSRIPDLDLDTDAGSSMKLLAPHLDPWLALPRQIGIRLKVIFHRDGAPSRHVLVRLDGGAELGGHKHGTDELVSVLDGCLFCNNEKIRPGDYLCNPAGSQSASLRSLGESTVLLIDSDRRFE